MSYKDFTFGKALGEGSFGSVNIVTRNEDHKTYALKKVKIAKLSKKEVENALNEIRLLYSLSHPNIVAYHESFYDEPSRTLNIVMEFCDDGDLAGKIKNNLKKKLSLDETTIWNWFLQILKGLKYLHGKHVMHRDLKTANIFLTKQGLVKIGDLNISKKLNEEKNARTQTGTPLYCPPEIWQDIPYDYRCDIWSTGCILYELAEGRTPFTGTSMKELATNIIKGIYKPISSRYSNDLSKIIKLMLTPDFKKRPTVDDLLKSDIISRKMKEIDTINETFRKTGAGVCMFMKTIKVPKNIKDIGKALPQKRYAKKREEEDAMCKRDNYETLKKTFLQSIIKEEPKPGPKIEKLNVIKEEEKPPSAKNSNSKLDNPNFHPPVVIKQANQGNVYKPILNEPHPTPSLLSEKERKAEAKRQAEQFNKIRNLFVKDYHNNYNKNKANKMKKGAVIGKFNYVPNQNKYGLKPSLDRNLVGGKNIYPPNQMPGHNNQKVIIKKIGKK